jgi:hypothetical protein
MIEASCQIASDFRQRTAALWHEYHVGVGRQDPSVRRVRASDSHISCNGLERLQVCPRPVSLVNMRPDTQDPHHFSRTLGQRIADGFRKRGKIIWRIIVNEQDLIGGVGQNLRHAIQTEGTALVKIVSVAVISTIENNRNHYYIRMVKEAPPSRRTSGN